MAQIGIKKRRENVLVSNEKGSKLKVMRFGDEHGRGKMPLDTPIDLGEWSGELGQIASVELDRAERGEQIISESEIRKALEGLKLTPGKLYEVNAPSGRVLQFKSSSSEEYAVSLGLIKFDDFHNIVVRDPNGYIRINKILAVIQKRDDAKTSAMEAIAPPQMMQLRESKAAKHIAVEDTPELPEGDIPF